MLPDPRIVSGHYPTAIKMAMLGAHSGQLEYVLI
jgi:hypothetical protein